MYVLALTNTGLEGVAVFAYDANRGVIACSTRNGMPPGLLEYLRSSKVDLGVTGQEIKLESGSTAIATVQRPLQRVESMENLFDALQTRGGGIVVRIPDWERDWLPWYTDEAEGRRLEREGLDMDGGDTDDSA